MCPDVAQRGRTQEGVGDGMGHGVCVGVADEPEVAGNLDATEDQTTAAREPM